MPETFHVPPDSKSRQSMLRDKQIEADRKKQESKSPHRSPDRNSSGK